ncbi:nuclear pore membrane glycoprotein 210 [Battus philenor]|uniref:nuclear pore membrane glycoprotein 210 n=1 Tax=Battus philenor TaxID=42288 RepID=UPI0035D13155
MELLKKILILEFSLLLTIHIGICAKINTPRVLLPWFENLYVNFTFEIIEGGCYKWSLSRDDIIDLEALYDDSWGHCSRAARVSVSKMCSPPGSVIILAEEVNTGEILRGDVNIDIISSLKITSTTWKLFLEEAPEAFEVVAYDDQGNKFSSLEGISFSWSIENLGNNYGEDPLVTFVRWRDTDYEAPPGVAELEAKGLRSHSVLLYGQAMGDCQVTVCLENICTKVNLQVVASVVLNPAKAVIAHGDTLRYKVVRMRAGRLTVQNIVDTLYSLSVPDTKIAKLEDAISLVRGAEIGTTTIYLMSGITEVATAQLTVTQPYNIRVTLRPANLVVYGEVFVVHCVVYDSEGRALTAGDEMLIRLSVEGEANVDLIRSTENGTITDAIAQNAGAFTITARLHSIAGRTLITKVEGQVSATAIEPLQIVPPELYIAWNDNMHEIQLKYIGGGDEPVAWSERETTLQPQNLFSLTPAGAITIYGIGQIDVKVHLKQYSHVKAYGKVWTAMPELVQVSSSGHARIGRPHHLHIALTATHPTTGELYNFHMCDCAAFAVTLLEGPEPYNVSAATWIKPVEGACCVLECAWSARGVSLVRVSHGRVGDTARVAVRAAPRLHWPLHAAALLSASAPVLAEGEALVPSSSDSRVAELVYRDGPSPHKYPELQVFTFRCRRKGDARLEITSQSDDERESVDLEIACAPHVSRIRLEPPASPGNCSGGPKLWLRRGQEVAIKVTLMDAIGRELLDEHGPRMSWEVQPNRAGIEFTATDRLFVETDPEYAPVPVPHKYYQMVVANEQAEGWTGLIKASIPEATASIQARVVAPLQCDPIKLNIAWEGESVSSIATVTGGSGKYTVQAAKGVIANIEDGTLTAVVPAPGIYDLLVTDLCVQGEKQLVEVNIEEVLSVEVITARAVCVDGCVPISALVKGVSQRYLTSSRPAEWRTVGHIKVKEGKLCGLREGTGRVRASLAGVWSPEIEVVVFPALRVVPEVARVPPGARLQLRHTGGPPAHLADLHYHSLVPTDRVDVSSNGLVHGLAMGKARIKLVATDIANVVMATAEAEIEVVPISGLRVRSATQSLLVGSPTPVWIEASGLTVAALSAVQPPPRVTWTIRVSTIARVYTGHADDRLERSVVEGLSVRVVPLKPGVITIDVRVRNMGQVAETRSWDSTIEILGISDIRTMLEGFPSELSAGDRLSIATGSTLRLKSVPRCVWTSYGEGILDVTPSGEVKGLRPGHGVIVAQHKDERNHIYRESIIHVEVATPHYCTAETSGSEDDSLRIVMRNNIGRELLAPEANVSVTSPVPAHVKRAPNSALGSEVLFTGLDAMGAFVSFQASAGGVTVTDEVLVVGADAQGNRIVAAGSWAVCLEGIGWRAGGGVGLYAGSGVTLAVITADALVRHTLRLDRPPAAITLHQVPLTKVEFLPGEWPYSKVPLNFEAAGLTSGPLLCSEDQKYALEGLQVELPYTCRTKAPYLAQPILDIANGQLGCSIIPPSPVSESTEVELCAEWGVWRTCTRILLLPPIEVSVDKVSLTKPPATFTITGHPRALKLVKMTTAPGLKLEVSSKDSEITVTVKSETVTCGIGHVNIVSRLTAQDITVEVEREYEIACGTVLGAIFSLLTPYLPTLMTIVAIGAAYLYIQQRLESKGKIRMPTEPVMNTVLPQETSPIMTRPRTWSRSPYASNGPSVPTVPVYGDASVLPDSSFSPNSSRMHSKFL